MKRANREKKRYACTGNHSDVTHPTTLISKYRPKRNTQEAAIEQERRKKDYDSYHYACNNNEKNHERKSPTTSPTKKKPRHRRNAVNFSMTAMNTSGGVESDGDEESDAADKPQECYGAPWQRLFSSYSNKEDIVNGSSPACSSRTHAVLSQCVTPAAAGNEILESADKKKDDYRTVLEDTNARLNERVIELARSNFDLVVKMEALTAEIERLKKVKSNDVHNEGNNIDDRGQRRQEDEEDKEEKNASEMTKRHRIQVENAELSRELAMLINDFVTSSRFVDGRKFPNSRLGRIVLESILSFEWTHSKISKRSPYSSSCDRDAWSAFSALLNVNMKRCRNKSKAAILVDCMWNDDFLDGEAQRYMIERVRCYLRKHVFTPWKIVKAMDVAGFNLSLAGLEVLRRVDVAGKYA